MVIMNEILHSWMNFGVGLDGAEVCTWHDFPRHGGFVFCVSFSVFHALIMVIGEKGYIMDT